VVATATKRQLAAKKAPAARKAPVKAAAPAKKPAAAIKKVAAAAPSAASEFPPHHERMLEAFQDPWFPYSNLWNGYCPLLRLGVRVDALEQLQAIPEESIREAHDVDLASIWCLEPGSWDGTELEQVRE